MIWIYIFFSIVELILAYTIYSAVSFEVIPGEKIFKDYVLCCRNGEINAIIDLDIPLNVKSLLS